MLRLRTETRKNYSFIFSLLVVWLLSVPSAFAATTDVDFAKRCADPGVVKCVNFDSPADIAGRWTNNSGLTIGASTAVIDPSVKASGGGSLLFTIPSQSWGD